MLGPDRYATAKRVFLEASRMPRGERTRFVLTQCEGDDELHEHVRRLLAVDESGDEFLERPALAVAGSGLAPGTRLGRYRVVRLLGEGGMGVVYEAEQDEPARHVALKIIRAGYLSERLRSRFRHEIRVLGQLRHPGIAQIYDAGTLEVGGERVPYFAMELIEGRLLLACAGALKLGVRERLELVAQVCDAVHHAHQKGVVHRDLKPANILVEETGSTDGDAPSGRPPLQVKVLDFGVARVTDADVRAVTIQTSAQQLVGTVPYMSPEQAAADPEGVDIRTDVYSIGVVAFELLAGRLPHPIQGRALHEAVRAIREDEPARLGSIDRALRGDVDTIVAKALEKDRERRYGSAAEMAADIRRFLRDEPIAARPPSALYHLRTYARRHKPLVAAAGIVLLAMVAATIVSAWQAGVALRAKALAEEGQGRADRRADVARRPARRATLAAVAAATDDDPIAARQLLQDTEEDGRGWAWRYWDARQDRSVAMVAAQEDIADAWVSPDGAEVMILTRDGIVTRGNPGDVKPVARLPGGPFYPAAFSADGARVVAACGADARSLDLFDTGDGRLVRHVADLDAPARLLEASADAGVICAGLNRTPRGPPADEVWVWGAAGGAAGHPLRQAHDISGLALSRDGRWAALGLVNLTIWDTASFSATTSPGEFLNGLRYAISDDGAAAAAGGPDKLVRIWRRGVDEPLVLRGHAGSISALAFDHAGLRLASAGEDLTIRLWDARTGEARGVLTGHTGPVRRLRFCADDSRLMSVGADRTVRLWTPDPAEGVTVLRDHSSYVYGVAFTPDGSRLVSAGWDRSIRVWDAASGRSIRVISDAGPGVITALAVSPDGATIVSARKTGHWDPAQVCLWDTASGQPLEQFPFAAGEVTDLVFNRAGTRLWMGWENGGVGVADLSAHPPGVRDVVTRHATYAVAVSQDERRIVIGGDAGGVRIADADTGDTIRGWTGHADTVTAVAWCPSRPLVASASADSTVRLWNSDTGRLVARLDRHWGKVFALAFSPDGDYLASGSDDTTIRIWDTDSGEDLTQLRGHEGYVYSLAFSPDGRMLVSGSGDGTVRVWDTVPVRERWGAAGRSP